MRGAGQVSVMDGERETMCVDMLKPVQVRRSGRTTGSASVQPVNDKPPQWNGIFSIPKPVHDMLFVTRLSLDCQASDTKVEDRGAAGISRC